MADAQAVQNAQLLNAARLFSVDGLVAVVTGGGTGIGFMMAKALALNGASKVYIAGRRADILSSAASSLNALVAATATSPSNPEVVVPIVCDVSSVSSLQDAAATVAAQSGHLDLLICNAGIGGPQVATPPVADGAEAESLSATEWSKRHLEHEFATYNRTFEVNAGSVWYTTMAFVPLLEEGNKKRAISWGSQVVVTSSIAAFNKAAPGGWAYGQSKAAATLAVKQLAIVLPRWGIRANCICPGLFPSEMAAPIVKLYGDASEGLMPKEMVPLRRMGDEQDMAATILYLASRGGAYCNGAVLVLDGGRLGNFPATF